MTALLTGGRKSPDFRTRERRLLSSLLSAFSLKGRAGQGRGAARAGDEVLLPLVRSTFASCTSVVQGL